MSRRRTRRRNRTEPNRTGVGVVGGRGREENSSAPRDRWGGIRGRGRGAAAAPRLPPPRLLLLLLTSARGSRSVAGGRRRQRAWLGGDGRPRAAVGAGGAAGAAAPSCASCCAAVSGAGGGGSLGAPAAVRGCVRGAAPGAPGGGVGSFGEARDAARLGVRRGALRCWDAVGSWGVCGMGGRGVWPLLGCLCCRGGTRCAAAFGVLLFLERGAECVCFWGAAWNGAAFGYRQLLGQRYGVQSRARWETAACGRCSAGKRCSAFGV